ncbi:MAG TPA: hypothetical protein VKT28_07525 [Puia sp.]|nr:hypothetical protein [Puia sp.]
MEAQQKDAVAGEYYLQGVMETASGIQLKPDSTFEFFYSYGALDRYGSGKWSIANHSIELNSRTRPPLDFKLISGKKTAENSITIKISDKNTNLLRYVLCIVKTKNGEHQQMTNVEGIAQFPKEKADSVSLIFQWCPDRFSTFNINSDNNYFEFGFEPWIAEIFFEHFQLKIEKNKLTGKHPLMEGDNFRYVKD